MPNLLRSQVLKSPVGCTSLSLSLYLYVFQVASIYFKSHLWGMKREPIRTPFLSKAGEQDSQESLAIFKLVLR